MNETQTLKFNPKSAGHRADSLVAVYRILAHFLSRNDEKRPSRDEIFRIGPDACEAWTEVRLFSDECLKFAQEGLFEAVSRARRQLGKTQSDRLKRVETTKRVAEMEKKLREVLSKDPEIRGQN